MTDLVRPIGVASFSEISSRWPEFLVGGTPPLRVLPVGSLLTESPNDEMLQVSYRNPDHVRMAVTR